MSGLLGGLSVLSVDWSEVEAPRDLWSWGDDLEDEEKQGEGDLCEGDTDIGDKVLEAAVSVILLEVCSEKRLAEKKLGFEFLKQGELGGTGGLGSLAGL